MDQGEMKAYKNASKNEANFQPSWPKKLGQDRIYYTEKISLEP